MPPVPRKIPRELEAHGDARVDDYYWMRSKDTPEVMAHLEAENAYAEAFLAPQGELRKRIYGEILGRIKQTDESVPVRDGAYWHYSRTIEGQQYGIYCRKHRSLEAEEEVVLDLNPLGEEHGFVGLGDFEYSHDGRYVAYTLDLTGFRQYRLRVRDLQTGADLPITAERVTSVCFAADNCTLFFTVEDEVTKRSFQLLRQRLDETEATPLYEESDERFDVAVGLSRSREVLVLHVHSHTTSEVLFLPADQPTGEWQVIAEREQDIEYYPAHRGQHFFLRTNDKGRNFRVVRAPLQSPGRANWEEIEPHDPEVMLEGLDAFQDHLVLTKRVDGLNELEIVPTEGARQRVAFPDPVYEVYVGQNPEFDTRELRFDYESMSRPDSVYVHDLTTQERRLLKQTEVLGGYDAERYVVTRRRAKATDGTEIPVSVVHAKDVALDGSAPCLLVGYGAYGYPHPAGFSYSRVSLLDRGFVVAIAHVRGGGEMGKRWHDEGRTEHKMNSFTDFVACAEDLIAAGYTSAKRLAAEGGSAGGLLMGAVANLRPDLFGAILSHVPFVDVLTTMSDPDLPLTVGEYEEWGNPGIAPEYRTIRRYCPYSNLEAKAYPPMLVRTSYNDSQVMYWEPAKYVAKLRQLKTDDHPVVFLCNMEGGHGGSSGRYDRLKEVALDFAFVVDLLAPAKA